MDKNTRVAAAISMDNSQVQFLGYGTYVGDEVPGPDAGGMASLCHQLNRPNPKIVLENGDVVWGGECWWGDADKFDKRTVGLVRVPVRIADIRAES